MLRQNNVTVPLYNILFFGGKGEEVVDGSDDMEGKVDQLFLPPQVVERC